MVSLSNHMSGERAAIGSGQAGRRNACPYIASPRAREGQDLLRTWPGYRGECTRRIVIQCAGILSGLLRGSMPERILIGVAWPYANGSLHMGHIAGCYLAADVFARYHRLKGNDVLMVSGSDQHGTPITLRAEQDGVSPQEVVSRYHKEFLNRGSAWGSPLTCSLLRAPRTTGKRSKTSSASSRRRATSTPPSHRCPTATPAGGSYRTGT